MTPRRLTLTQTTWDGNADQLPVDLSADHPTFIIGSSEDADLCLDDPAIAERHGSLTLTNEGVEFASLLSYPLAVCNGVPVYMPIQLADGDTIQLGDTALVVHFEEASADNQPTYEAPAQDETTPPLTPSADMPVPAAPRASRGLTPGAGGSRGLAAPRSSAGSHHSAPQSAAGSRGLTSGSRSRTPTKHPSTRDSDSQSDDLVSRLIFRLQAEFPQQTASRTRRVPPSGHAQP